MIVSMCLLPAGGSFAVSYQIYGNLIKGSVRDLCHLQGILLNLCFVASAEGTVCYVFPDVLIHTFPIVLAFD